MVDSLEVLNMPVNRITVIVLDSVGIGALPDAAKYGDEESNTLSNTAKAVGGVNLPNLEAFGLANAAGVEIQGISPVDKPLAAFGKSAEKSAGKDTTTGHWEIAGIILEHPFPIYPSGFPPEIIQPLEAAINRKVLWNKPASGTEIIARLGEEHMRTGYPIVYTSADSVFQVAGHEEVIPLDELYEICRKARALLTGKHAVGRVIARPFMGTTGNFKRTKNRKDFSVKPPSKTVLNNIAESGMEVVGVGKINDIFAGEGITRSLKTADNMDGVDKIIQLLKTPFHGLIFSNLVEFDMLFGHRNNPVGYAGALEAFDNRLPEIIAALGEGDILVITADHGCDPTTPGTDHTREYVPLLIYGKPVNVCCLGIRETFADLGATIADLLKIPPPPAGESFARRIVPTN
jgi:phosphopentomutase